MEYLWLKVIIALLGCAFFAASESAFISSNKLLFELENKEKNFIRKILALFYKHPEQYLSSMILGNVICLILYGILISELTASFLHSYNFPDFFNLSIQIVIAAIFILIVGEYIPKTIAKINGNRFLTLLSIPLFIFYIILYPFSKLISLFASLVCKLFGVKFSFGNSKISGREELDQLIQQTIEDTPEDTEPDTEIVFFQNAMEFSQVKVRDCIVPRTEIIAVDKSASLKELRAKFIESGLSKIVVYENDIDNIIGYIHSSELFNKPEDWTEHIISLPFFPENMAANKLMKNMLSQKKGMAVVVDEFGGTSGIITLEDLVEEIFGEIEDEHDAQNLVAKQTGDNEYILSGRMEIDRVNELFDLDIPESDEYLTIAGYILNYYQNFPKLNETVSIDQFNFKIIRVTRTKIELVKLSRNKK